VHDSHHATLQRRPQGREGLEDMRPSRQGIQVLRPLGIEPLDGSQEVLVESIIGVMRVLQIAKPLRGFDLDEIADLGTNPEMSGLGYGWYPAGGVSIDLSADDNSHMRFAFCFQAIKHVSQLTQLL
jgi:hypothetical protein